MQQRVMGAAESMEQRQRWEVQEGSSNNGGEHRQPGRGGLGLRSGRVGQEMNLRQRVSVCTPWQRRLQYREPQRVQV